MLYIHSDKDFNHVQIFADTKYGDLPTWKEVDQTMLTPSNISAKTKTATNFASHYDGDRSSVRKQLKFPKPISIPSMEEYIPAGYIDTDDPYSTKSPVLKALSKSVTIVNNDKAPGLRTNEYGIAADPMKNTYRKTSVPANTVDHSSYKTKDSTLQVPQQDQFDVNSMLQDMNEELAGLFGINEFKHSEELYQREPSADVEAKLTLSRNTHKEKDRKDSTTLRHASAEVNSYNDGEADVMYTRPVPPMINTRRTSNRRPSSPKKLTQTSNATKASSPLRLNSVDSSAEAYTKVNNKGAQESSSSNRPISPPNSHSIIEQRKKSSIQEQQGKKNLAYTNIPSKQIDARESEVAKVDDKKLTSSKTPISYKSQILEDKDTKNKDVKRFDTKAQDIQHTASNELTSSYEVKSNPHSQANKFSVPPSPPIDGRKNMVRDKYYKSPVRQRMTQTTMK